MMALWGGYFDDSENEGHLAVGGCVAPLDSWEQVTPRCIDVLKAFDVSYFHSTDFHASRKEFETWKGDKVKRERFYSALLDLIDGSDIRPVGYVIAASYRQAAPTEPDAQMPAAERHRLQHPEGFRKVVKLRTERLLRDEYCQCLAWCLNAAAGLIEHEEPDVRLRVVVADQAKRNGFIPVLYEMAKSYARHRTRLTDEITTQANPHQMIPLQVADLIAWETTKDRVLVRPSPGFLRLRQRGLFRTGNPPRMFADWVPEGTEHIMVELSGSENDDAGD